MSEQTLIDLLGLCIQASGIFIALVSVYAFFRLEKIKDLLIGQGKAVFKSQNDIKKGIIVGPQLLDKYYRRLRDSIDRKNIFGIEESLIRLAIIEIKTNSKKDRGYIKNILKKFIKTKKYQKCIKNYSIGAILLFTITVVLSFISIFATEYCYQCYYTPTLYFYLCYYTFTMVLFVAVGLSFAASLFTTGILIYKSNFKLVGFEKVTKERCSKLKNKYPDEIKSLY